MGGSKEKNLKTPKSVKCPASISKNPVPLYLQVVALEIGICLLIISQIADVGIPETPTPLALANIGNGDTPPPLRHADVLNGWSLIR
jgi:hypothetical protein